MKERKGFVVLAAVAQEFGCKRTGLGLGGWRNTGTKRAERKAEALGSHKFVHTAAPGASAEA